MFSAIQSSNIYRQKVGWQREIKREREDTFYKLDSRRMKGSQPKPSNPIMDAVMSSHHPIVKTDKETLHKWDKWPADRQAVSRRQNLLSKSHPP